MSNVNYFITFCDVSSIFRPILIMEVGSLGDAKLIMDYDDTLREIVS